MNVLCVGGAGYLGGALTEYDNGNEFMVYDSLVYEESYRKGVPFYCGDVRDHDSLKPHLGWADCVVWLAGIVGDGACALNPSDATEVNYDSVKWLTENFDGRIIFMSTCSVYGAQEELLTEDSPTNPLSLYASTKLKAESLLKDRNALVLRLGTLFGIGDEWSRIRLDLVVNTLTAKAVIDRKMRVFGGEQYRPLLHVRDAAEVIRANIGTGHTGVFNLVGENSKIVDIADMVKESVYGTELEIVETTFEDSRNYRVDGSKSKNTLRGIEPATEISEGITEVRDLLLSGRIKDPKNPRYTNQGFLSG